MATHKVSPMAWLLRQPKINHSPTNSHPRQPKLNPTPTAPPTTTPHPRQQHQHNQNPKSNLVKTHNQTHSKPTIETHGSSTAPDRLHSKPTAPPQY